MRTTEPIRSLWLILIAALAAGQQKEFVSLPRLPEDLAAGQRLYATHCAPCHGQTGKGGRAPSLDHPKLSAAADDDGLVSVIQNGIDGSGMPAASQLTDLEARQVAAYVRQLGRPIAGSLPGDPARGRLVFDTKGGCGACHIVKGAGTGLGPELTKIGAQRGPAYLKEALLEPTATVPEGFLIVRALSREGRLVRGIRLNEDAFTIQLKDAGNRFYSLRKSELKQLEKQFGATLMPSYAGKLSNSEIDDLVAYLASLREEP